MIDSENLPPEIEELKDDEDIDLETSISQLVDEEVPTETVAASQQEVSSETESANLSDSGSDKVIQLISETVALKRQVDERNGQYTRLYADFDNFRKRTQREKEEEEDRINAKILKKFLAVVDDFERAQSQIKPKTDAEANIQTSYQSVYKQLVKCLKDSGVVRIRALGEEFDPNFHEAIAQEPTDKFDEGAVMEELRPGYLLGERVLRHTLVKVAAAGNGDHTTEKLENTAETVENTVSSDS